MQIAVLIAAANSFAWPVDVYVDLEAGADKIEKLAAVSWVEVEDASIASAELLPGGELLLTGKTPGRTLVLLYAEGRFAVWRLRVAAKGAGSKVASGEATAAQGEALSAAKTACGKGLVIRGAEVTAQVNDDRCRKALLALFETDAYKARDLSITFEVAALQAQLAAIEKSFKDGGQTAVVRYSGAGLVLEGKGSAAAHRSALWALFKSSVGRVPLDDRFTVSDAHPGPASGPGPQVGPQLGPHPGPLPEGEGD